MHLFPTELVVGCRGRRRLCSEGSRNQGLQDKLELAGRQEVGKENGILNRTCAGTKAWRQEAFDGHCKWFSLDGV